MDEEVKTCKTVHSDGNKCRNRAIDGKDFCSWCFKRQSPVTRDAQRKKEIEHKSKVIIGELMKKEDVPIEVDELGLSINPFDALLDIVEEQVRWKDTCQKNLNKLKVDEWRWDGDRAGEQLRSEVVLYERAIERCTNTLVKIARLGIEDRLARIAMRQQSVMEQAIVRTFADMGLSIEQQAQARIRMVHHLRNA